MRWLKRAGLWGAMALLVALAVGQRFGDPSLDPGTDEATVTLQLIDYGFHVALFLPRDALREAAEGEGAHRLAAVTGRFAAYPTLELGWGDEGFYRTVPTIADLQVGPGLSAILGLNTDTVLQVVGWYGPVDAPYPGGARTTLTISKRAFARMIPLLEATLAGGSVPEELGPGLYGPSLFYRATGHYSLFNVCNHWTARLMVAAGRSVNLTLATVSRLLIWQLS